MYESVKGVLGLTRYSNGYMVHVRTVNRRRSPDLRAELRSHYEQANRSILLDRRFRSLINIALRLGIAPRLIVLTFELRIRYTIAHLTIAPSHHFSQGSDRDGDGER